MGRDYGTRVHDATRANEKTKLMPDNSLIPPLVGWIGDGLTRPECALTHGSGLLCVPSWAKGGGVSIINTRGDTRHILSNIPQTLAPWLAHGLRPNGIALEENGQFLLAHLGDERGGVFRLDTEGNVEPVVLTVHGDPMPPANYLVKDRQGRLWITVSTRKSPRAKDYRPDACTGFIAVCEPGGSDAHIVADGLGYTNECVIDEIRGRVFVNETFAQRLTEFELNNNGQLSKRTTKATFGHGTFPDGLALDMEGGLWVTSIVSNRVIQVKADGQQKIWVEDSDTSHVDHVVAAFERGEMGRPHLDNVSSTALKNISNLAFGGPDLSRCYLGNLLGETIPWFDAPVSGAPLPHWDLPLGTLAEFVG